MLDTETPVLETSSLPPLPMTEWGYVRDKVVDSVKEQLIRLVNAETERAVAKDRGVLPNLDGAMENINNFAGQMVDLVFTHASLDTTIIASSLGKTTDELMRARQEVADLKRELERYVIKAGDLVTTTYRPSQLRDKQLKVLEVFPDDSDLGDMLKVALPGGGDITILAASCKKVMPQSTSEVPNQ